MRNAELAIDRDASDDREFAVVRPFPVIDVPDDDLVVPPREWSTLTDHPEPVMV